MKKAFIMTYMILSFLSISINGQTVVFMDSLQGGSDFGTMVGGYFHSEGYRPNRGFGHILYELPYQVSNGYLEFQIKGFSPELIDDPEGDADNGFFGMYDGRGITEPIAYFNDFKTNFFRWNFHYRQNRSAFKSVIQCAAPTPERLNATKAVFGLDSEGFIAKDWGEEPMGIDYSFNTSSWYTVKAEWNNKQFTISINGTTVWQVEGPYDYAPIEHRIWLGSAPGHSDKYINLVSGLTYRNVKVVTYEITDSLSISSEEINVDFTSGDSNFQIYSNTDWELSFAETWISTSQLIGNGDTTVVLSYEENDSFDPRTAIIEVSTGNLVDTLTIIQDGRPLEYINVVQDTVSVDFPAGELSLSVQANIDWYIMNEEDWVSVSRVNFNQNDTLLIEYDQNNSSNQRAADITLTNDTIITVLSIFQAGSDIYINISKRTWEVSKNSGNVTFYIESNQNWSLQPNVNWLTPSYQDSSGDATFMVHYGVNTDTSSRTGYVLIVGDYVTDSVGVIQAGADPVEIIIQVNPAEAGSVLGGGIYGYGASANLEAIANEGWEFDNWTESGSVVASDSIYSFQVQTERNLIANFSIATGVEEFNYIPTDFSLSQNYPNPFNPTTLITFGLPEDAFVRLTIYNLLGQVVRKVISSDFNTGFHSINFDASDLPSGTYIYSIHASGNNRKEFVQSKKMLLIK